MRVEVALARTSALALSIGPSGRAQEGLLRRWAVCQPPRVQRLGAVGWRREGDGRGRKFCAVAVAEEPRRG
eukprot:3043539-Alexandrium_andersonii.AAC.1